jgi:hypothetical protein
MINIFYYNMKYISLPIFIISLAIGLFVGYIFGPEMKIVYVYPTLENVGKTQYEDSAGSCFVYKETEVTCPDNEDSIKEFPIQN